VRTEQVFRKEFWVPRAKPQYPPQFKAEAVQLVQSSGSSISKIAKDLGISGTSLRNWVKQAQIDQGEREGLTTEEREELRKLRRENKVLKQEKRDFLKTRMAKRA
jgi:transposase